MIAESIVQKIIDRIAERVDVGVGEHESQSDLIFINAPYVYSDGDHSRFSISRTDKGWVISDDGDVFRHARYRGADLLGDATRQEFHEIIASHGVIERNRRLSLDVDGEGFGKAYFSFAQACIEVAGLGRTRSAFSVERRSAADQGPKPMSKAKLAEKLVSASAIGGWMKNWSDEAVDEEGAFPVDRCLNTGRGYVFGFGIASRAHCDRAAATTFYYRERKVPIRSLAVMEEAEIPEKGVVALERAGLALFDAGDVGGIKKFVNRAYQGM